MSDEIMICSTWHFGIVALSSKYIYNDVPI